PVNLAAATRFLAHGALRLSANDAAFAPLWKEQLGPHWREPGKHPFTWPVLASEQDRAAVRAALDAAVAAAYGLSREQYAYILAAQPAAWPQAGQQCLASFDAIHELGLAAFVGQHDPYHDVPLPEGLPIP